MPGISAMHPAADATAMHAARPLRRLRRGDAGMAFMSEGDGCENMNAAYAAHFTFFYIM